ncbi:uncharacterized protein [Narcine bancroftii]|uniref:uncharacterized protein isoform X2 n=1 Tax=Narcine bancroftii TaxID=1343680 RepID=UPI0038311148
MTGAHKCSLTEATDLLDSQPSVWLEQAEDSTRYYYTVSALDQETTRQIIDFVFQLPATDSHEATKALLIHTFSLSQCEQAARLLHMDGLGDRTPTTLMNNKLALMDSHRPCLLFEQIFLKHMLEEIRLLLADDYFSDSHRLAAHANVLWHVKQHDKASVDLVAASRPDARLSSIPPRRPATVAGGGNSNLERVMFLPLEMKF